MNSFLRHPCITPIESEELEEEFDNFFKGDVDAYNPTGFETTYRINAIEMRRYFRDQYQTGYHLDNFENYYAISLICKRKGNILKFIVYTDEKNVVKIGQHPSIADIQFAEIGKRYDKVLPKQDLHDLKKAIGLMAHGAGAGSLVYLRRIFENIIWKTYEKHKTDFEISGEDFLKKEWMRKLTS